MERNGTKFDGFCDKKRRLYGDKFDASELDARFVEFFNSGERIRVWVDIFDKAMSGTVGVTCGWRPRFLLMRRRTDRGSSITLGPKDKILGFKGQGEYIYRVFKKKY